MLNVIIAYLPWIEMAIFFLASVAVYEYFVYTKEGE